MGHALISNKKVLMNYGRNLLQKNVIKYNSTASTTEELYEKVEHNPRRDMSKLLRQNRNALLQNIPYDEPCSWIHLTEKYKRKIFGRYGLVSGIDPCICFSMRGKASSGSLVKETPLRELIYNITLSESNRKETLESREKEIAAKLVKLQQWKIDMRNKITKKEAETLALKEKKQRLMEEVRRHFGFKLDPKDDRFKEILEQKEREEKKKQKEAKRKAREDRMVRKLSEKTAHTSQRLEDQAK